MSRTPVPWTRVRGAVDQTRSWFVQATSTPGRAVLATLVVSVLVSLAASAFVGIPSSVDQLDDDEREYWELAEELSSGDYEFQSQRVPGFPLVLAGLQRLGLGLAQSHVALALIFALTAPLVTAMLTARFGLSSSRAAAIGIAVAVWPPFAFYGSSMYSETLALPLLALILLALAPGSKTIGVPTSAKRRWLEDVAVGLVLGLGTLVRPMFALYAPLLILTVLFENRLSVGLRRAATIGVVAVIVVLPWTVAVSTHYGSFVPLSTNGGETLAGGLNPRLMEMGTQVDVMPDGRTTWVGPGKWIPPDRTGYLTPAELGLDGLEKDELLRARTIEWMQSNPGDVAFLSFRKVVYMWGLYPVWNGAEQTAVGQVPTVLLSILVVTLFVRNSSLGIRLPRFWLLPIYVTLVALISWGSWRFRMPGDLGLLILGGILFFAEIDRRSRHGSVVGSPGVPGRH